MSGRSTVGKGASQPDDNQAEEADDRSFTAQLEQRARTLVTHLTLRALGRASASGRGAIEEGLRSHSLGTLRVHETDHENRWGNWSGSPTDVLEHQIALTLDHLDRARALHRGMLRQLMRVQLYVSTELLQRRPRPFSYIDVYRPERDRLKDKLWRLDDERRRLAMIHQERVQGLFDRLLSLVHKHAYVGE